MKIFTKKIDKFIIITNKIAKVLFDGRFNEVFYNTELVKVRTGSNKSKPIEVAVSIDYQGLKKQGLEIPESERLTPYDREIHNAVVSLYEAGNEYATPNMIQKILSGNKEYGDGTRKSLTQTNRQSILSSLSKMKETMIEIDANEEGRAYKKAEYKYLGKLLPMYFVQAVTLNNNTVKDCIHILRTPPLLEYSKLRRQLTSVDIELLAVLSNREPHVLIRDYLLGEIQWMKYSSRRRNIILYKTIEEYLGTQLQGDADSVNHKRKRLRDNVVKCLKYWVSKKYIKGYTEDKDRNTITKVLILLQNTKRKE